MTEKTFIAIGSETLNGKPVYLYATCGHALADANGISCERALEFLFSLHHQRKNKSGVVFVTYAFSRDNEFIFSTMPKNLRDKLFQSTTVKREMDRLEFELEQIEDDYYSFNKDTQEFELADFELYVNRLALDELTEIKYAGFEISLANGKMLTVRKNKKSITIYDIFGFFKPQSLRVSVKKFLERDEPLLDRAAFAPIDFFDGETDIEILKNHCAFETGYIAKLVSNLHKRLVSNDIHLSRFHGASAITSYILSKSGAKKEYHSYRRARQKSPNLENVLLRSTFGGRAEQFKIGTCYNVYIYDINSAYAAAAATLPQMLQKPQYTKTYDAGARFSFWECEYDFSNSGNYFGCIPNRHISNRTLYPCRGRGVFWQPEIKFLKLHFSDCVKIGDGYVLHNSDKFAGFTNSIKNLYDLRVELQEKKDPLEKVLGLAASGIYGKFCQHNGKSHYYNLFYAAYITSYTRAALLAATRGHEKETICFLTDAIHTFAKDLPVEISNKLGDYKVERFDKVVYLDNGVYQCYNKGEIVKTKTQGFRNFNFNSCLKELQDKRSYTALTEFFIGHNLFSQNILTSAEYLQDFAEKKTMFPAENHRFAMREFIAENVNLTKGFLDSRMINEYNGIASSPYRIGNNRVVDMNLDTLLAGRV